jgi:hypothetical protein
MIFGSSSNRSTNSIDPQGEGLVLSVTLVVVAGDGVDEEREQGCRLFFKGGEGTHWLPLG